MKKSYKNKEYGFTLIELLVVLGIIMLLSSLLLPGIQNMMERSKLIKCSGNLKNIYQALSLYAVEHEGRLPNPSGEGSNRRFASYINPYLDPNYDTNKYNRWFVPEEFRCPLEKEYWGKNRQHCVGFNFELAGANLNNRGGAKTIMLGDTAGSFYVWLSRGDYFLHFRHFDPSRKGIGVTSLIYGDGHWGSLKKGTPLITFPLIECPLFVRDRYIYKDKTIYQK